MYKTQIEQIELFKIGEDHMETAREVNARAIWLFVKHGNYPTIIQSGNYVTIVYKELVETNYEPQKMEFINVPHRTTIKDEPQPVYQSWWKKLWEFFTGEGYEIHP